MFEGLQKIKDVLEHIEENITSDLDYKVLASKMGLSVYEFRRIFSFVIGLPIAEYIRKRRLSLAAFEITKNEKVDMLKLSEKYGYSSQSAFSKAFSEYHGIAPTVLMKEKRDVTLLTVPKFDLKINASENINFSVIKREKFYIQGFSGVSSITDSCCCENVWNSFYDSGADKKIDSDRIFVSYKNEGENVLCTIGSLADELQRELPFEEIPESLWA
ncbi:MAG: helix-turn-helix transcriptional regulator, partial [Ruminococcaceae bacterium]|nr:helix-turn-helix transcriptional regulator [Oscillospiraceae bacterium]